MTTTPTYAVQNISAVEAHRSYSYSYARHSAANMATSELKVGCTLPTFLE
jgi:hypothetical protein